jgi:hypothetical protein
VTSCIRRCDRAVCVDSATETVGQQTQTRQLCGLCRLSHRNGWLRRQCAEGGASSSAPYPTMLCAPRHGSLSAVSSAMYPSSAPTPGSSTWVRSWTQCPRSGARSHRWIGTLDVASAVLVHVETDSYRRIGSSHTRMPRLAPRYTRSRATTSPSSRSRASSLGHSPELCATCSAGHILDGAQQVETRAAS